MNPQDFVNSLLPFAKDCQGFDPGIILTQAALESAWGAEAPGNMFFGIKDTDGVNGNEQLIETTEISRSAILKPEQIGLASIDRVTPITINGQKFFQYVGKGYFRKYNTPKESFDDHVNFFLTNGIYARACTLKEMPLAFFAEIAKIGYATDPDYFNKLSGTYRTGIKPFLT